MKRELLIHIFVWLIFFLLLSILKGFLSLPFWTFWLGGFVGVFLPDLDHIIYAYFSKPQDLTSQRVNYLIQKQDIQRAIQLLYETRNERKNLIFHTILFQGVIVLLTLLMISSSVSFFGKGLALSFSIHLLIDQVIDLVQIKSLENWFNLLPLRLNLNNSKVYLGALVFVICFLAVLM